MKDGTEYSLTSEKKTETRPEGVGLSAALLPMKKRACFKGLTFKIRVRIRLFSCQMHPAARFGHDPSRWPVLHRPGLLKVKHQ